MFQPVAAAWSEGNALNSTLIDLEELLRTEGLHAGLTFLNGRVPHRFTAVYRLDELMLHMVDMVDRTA
jgi:hypothetical protein